MIDKDAGAFQLGYVPSLDGLRGLAILAVMGFNAHLGWTHGGFLGVDLFFALSGFLITCVLLEGYAKTFTIRLKEFYVRRAFRLLPALFALMAFCVAYALLLQSGEKTMTTLGGVFYTLIYVANWAQVPPNPPGIGPLSHAWSLSVEEQFYIVWPLLLLVLLKVNRRWLIVSVLILLIASSIALNIFFWNSGTPHLRMYFGSDTRAHQLLIGCAAALLLSWGTFNSQKLRLPFHALAAVSLVLILLAFYFASHTGPFVYNGGFALIALGTTVLILDFFLFPSGVSRVFEFAPLVWIGKISYGLYLWHFPIFEASRRVFEGKMNPIFYQIIGFITTLLVATASYYLLEQRFLRFNRKGRSTDPAHPLLTHPSQTAARV
jgi:peptidoglycan/LPS O-acetylase OafA/YrhL